MTDIGILGAFLGGVLSLLSPCSALLLPSFFAYAFDSTARLTARTAVFYLGLAAVLVPLGAGVGALGSLLTRHRDLVTTVSGVVLIVLGVVTVLGGGFAFAPAQRAVGRLTGTGTLSVFALGAVYGFAGFCAGPLLGGVLTVATVGGDPVYGGLLMGLYALGMVVPLFVLALAWERFDVSGRRWLRGRPVRIGPLRTQSTALVSGLLFAGMGVLFLATDGTANLGGVLGVDDQFALQVWVGDLVDRIPVLALALVVAVALFVLVAVRVVRGSRGDRSDTFRTVGDADRDAASAER